MGLFSRLFEGAKILEFYFSIALKGKRKTLADFRVTQGFLDCCLLETLNEIDRLPEKNARKVQNGWQ